jgi:hypothetical protein
MNEIEIEIEIEIEQASILDPINCGILTWHYYPREK